MKLSRMAPLWILLAISLGAPSSRAQEAANERAFPQAKAAIEKVLQQVQAATSGRLPVLEGFATPQGHALERYQRGFYQAKFQVSTSPTGGSVVRVNVQLTAYYVDPSGAKSGYQVLPSNGRLEEDLLDQLADQLGAGAPAASVAAPNAPARQPRQPSAPTPGGSTSSSTEPALSAPTPRLPDIRSSISTSLSQSMAEQQKARVQAGEKTAPDSDAGPLQTEINSLQEVLKNQTHPKNLVAVKNSGTPVVSSASLNAKTLFLATAHDEFEMLDFNRDWVHVKISGLSRGWIWRNNLEMPDNVPDSDAPPSASAKPTASALFHVAREEVAPFPGDWEPLRGQKVKIVTVEQIDESAKDLDPRQKLEFAKSVLDQDYAELAKKPQELAGIVLVFDSADGGMIAAPFATLQRWKAGTITDASLWHQCFFDPPETFTPSTAASR